MTNYPSTQREGPPVHASPTQAREDETPTGDRHAIDDRYNFHDASFRRDFQLNYSDGAHDYDSYYAPAYRLGYELAAENQDAAWEAIKGEAQHHWQTKHSDSWQNVEKAVHYGWLEQRDPDALRVHHRGEYQDYRKGFMAHYAAELSESNDTSFEQYEPAYQYGYNLAIDPVHRTSLWSDIEPELRRYYEEEYTDGQMPWEHYRSAVEHAWYDVRATAI